MASSTEQLIFEILAKDAAASAAFDRFRNKVDQTSKSVDQNSAALDKNAKAADKNKQAQTSAIGALLGVGAAFAPITAGAVAAGLGVTAFAGLAVPSVIKVATALHGPGGLAAAWVTLDRGQRNVAIGLQALGNDYTDLAKKMEPQSFQVFNQGVALAQSLLGPVAKLAATSGQGISDFLASFSRDAGLQHFIAFLSTIARPAIGLLGSDVTHLSHTLFSLLQAFGGAGITELRLLTGVFTALDDTVSFLSQHAPGLTSVAITIGGIALALSKLGLLNTALKISGISNIAGQFVGFAEAAKGATAAEKGLVATTTVLDAINPWAWAALGVAALGGLVFWLSRTKMAASDTVTSIEAQTKAVGFNTGGYVAAAAAIKKVNDQQAQQTIQLRNSRSGMVTGTASINALTGATDTYNAAQQALTSGAKQQNTFLGTLADKYGLTRQQAVALAVASGVLVDKTGHVVGGLGAATAKADAYANANRAAQAPVTQLTSDISDYSNTTLTATARQTALTNALKLFFDPAVKADQDIITMKNDQVAMASALAASAGKTGLLTATQRNARGAFLTYIGDVATAASDAFAATNKTSSYTKIIHDALPTLYAAAGGNRTLRGEIQKLIDTMHGLSPENVKISVGATGTWTVTQFQAPGGGKHVLPVAGAVGMLVRGGVPGQDSVPIMAMPGELVVPTSMVARGAVDHLRGQIPGFAAGGVVGTYGGSIPGLGRFLTGEEGLTVKALENAVAAATFAGIRQATALSAGGGGIGVGVARWAPDVLQVLHWLGQPAGDLAVVLRQMTTESGGNPTVVNRSDINWLLGHPSVGLMQVIAGTFGAFAGPFTGTGPFEYGVSVDPVANIYAGLNYAIHRYGPAWTSVLGQGHGYDQGGYLPTGLSLAYNGTGRPEPVGAAAGNTYHITVQVPPNANMAEIGRVTVGAIEAFEKRSGKGWRS